MPNIKVYECQISKLDNIHSSYISHAIASKYLNDKYVNRKMNMHGVGLLYKENLAYIITPIDI